MSLIDLTGRIPNNVNLAGDRRLQRALEAWLPAYLTWWRKMGPDGWQEHEAYLRTAEGVGQKGWARFGYVKMPDYRWGIFLADQVPDRTIQFGDNAGKPVWQEVPGEHRNLLRRLIVTQGDTEPGSVEQQRLLGATAPSLIDRRNLFQVNVEEGRHLWAMVYLLHAYFGREGREEADELLRRQSGDADHPRILDAFNQPCPDWLTFYCFTTFTDRDGKYQLGALAESGFDPLARTCEFMLIEEAHHLSVGEKGIERILRRAAELAKLDPNGDVRARGGIDVATIQRWINYWYSYSLDLFGGDLSTNAAEVFAAGLKGRFNESQYGNHTAMGTHEVVKVRDGRLVTETVPLRNALNAVLQDEYRKDCEGVMRRWNRALQQAGWDGPPVQLPSIRFHRRKGLYAGLNFDPDGNLITAGQFAARRDDWLPSAADYAYVGSLMMGVHEPGQMAHWIAPPRQGINGQSVEFQYVRM